MRIFELMVDGSEELKLNNGCEAVVLDNYVHNGEHQYDVVQIKTDNPLEDIRKVDSNGTEWMMEDFFESGKSSYTGEEVWSCPFWKEAK